MIIHDLSIHIVPYLLKPYDRAITNISFSWVGYYRIEFELSDDTMFDMINPVFFFLKLGWNFALWYIIQSVIKSIQWQLRFRNHRWPGCRRAFSVGRSLFLCLWGTSGASPHRRPFPSVWMGDSYLGIIFAPHGEATINWLAIVLGLDNPRWRVQEGILAQRFKLAHFYTIHTRRAKLPNCKKGKLELEGWSLIEKDARNSRKPKYF